MEQNFIENNVIILSKQTIDEFLKQDNPADLIALYSFYYYTAKWQKTNQPKCTTNYVAKGLHKSETWVRRTKKTLMNLKLIEDVMTYNEVEKKISGWYVKLNYIWKQETTNTIDFQEGCFNNSVANLGTNALSANSLNALSANSLNALSANNKVNTQKKDKETITKDNLHQWLIDMFYKEYFLKYNEPLVITGKEGSQIKRIIEYAKKVDANNPKDIILRKFNILKTNDFYKLTPGQLLSAWSNLVLNKPKEQQSEYRVGQIKKNTNVVIQS